MNEMSLEEFTVIYYKFMELSNEVVIADIQYNEDSSNNLDGSDIEMDVNSTFIDMMNEKFPKVDLDKMLSMFVLAAIQEALEDVKSGKIDPSNYKI